MKYFYLSILFLFFPTLSFAKKITIKWEESPIASGYELKLERDGKRIEIPILTAHSWTSQLEYGFYSYQIRVIDRIKRPGKWSPPTALIVSSPKPTLYPKKVEMTPGLVRDSADLLLKWASIPGVDRYQIQLIPREQEDDSLDKPKEINLTSRDPSIWVQNLPPNKYYWQVRALITAPARAPPSLQSRHWESEWSKKYSLVVSSSSIQASVEQKLEKSLPKKQILFKGDRMFSVSPAIMPFSFSHKHDTSSAALGLGLHLEHWIFSHWGISSNFNGYFARIEDVTKSFASLDFNIHFRGHLGATEKSVKVLPEIGLQFQQYPLSTPTTLSGPGPAPLVAEVINALGAKAGLYLEKTLFPRWTIYLGGSYFYPFATFGRQTIDMGSAPTNFNFGGRVHYQATDRMGWAMGTQIEFRSINYINPNTLSSESSTFSGLSVYGSFTFRIEDPHPK